jgi:hypothetical protein
MAVRVGPPQPVVVPDTLTSLHGSVYGVIEEGVSEPLYYIGVSRKVDGLSSQFAAALASGKSFPFVKIQTPSGHIVSFLSGGVSEITKAGYKPTLLPGPSSFSSPYGCNFSLGSYVAAGMEVITWSGGGQIAVDYVWVPTSYNWVKLNS